MALPPARCRGLGPLRFFLLYARAVLVPQLHPTTYNREVAEVSGSRSAQREGDEDSVAKLRSSRLEKQVFRCFDVLQRGLRNAIYYVWGGDRVIWSRSLCRLLTS